MAANIIDGVAPRQDTPRDPAQHTVDLDLTATTDVHEESTADLVERSQHPSAAHSPRRERADRRMSVSAAPTTVKAMHPPAARPTIAPGTILCDRYILERPIGQGGTSLVYRARDIRRTDGGGADAAIAIKTPLPGAKDPARQATRLQHEYERAKVLTHPNIVRVFDLHRIDHAEGETWLMTMELIDGKLLSTLMKERSATPVSLAHKILRACAQALGHAHSRQIVHGDFKPSNVFVMPDAGVKIVDFGAAAVSANDRSRIPAATPAYASPEVLSGETPETRDDVFSLACVAYELLTGRHPFERKSAIEARDQGWVPQRAWNLSTPQWLTLLSALSWQREQRPVEVESFVAGLTDELSDVVVPESHALHEPQVDLHPDDLPAEVMPRGRGWGFAAFAAAAVGLVFIAMQRPDDVPPPSALPLAGGAQPTGVMAAPAPSTLSSSTLPETSSASAPPRSASEEAVDEPPSVPADTATAPAAAKPKAPTAPPAPTSRISLDSGSIETSESSITAVFVVSRSGSLRGRSSVRWEARSVSAQVGEDFIVDSGLIEFADGQPTRAVYIPLRDDQLSEGDETFSISLRSPDGARLGAVTEAVITIKDDD